MLQVTDRNLKYGKSVECDQKPVPDRCGKCIFSERRDFHLSENVYFPRLLLNKFLVTLHRFPAFSCISSCHLEHNSQQTFSSKQIKGLMFHCYDGHMEKQHFFMLTFYQQENSAPLDHTLIYMFECHLLGIHLHISHTCLVIIVDCK